MFKAVIFDLDGTLVDTISDIAASMNAALASLGYPVHPDADYRAMVGRGLAVLARRALPPEARSEEIVEECRKRAFEAYLGAPADKSAPYPGIEQTLDALREKGIPCAVLTNKPDAVAALVVSKVLPGASFRAVVGAREGVPHKPDPTAALSLAASLGAFPRSVLLLGDSDVDVRTAQAAGFSSAGAAWGFRGRDELIMAGADLVLDKPTDLLAFI